MRHVEDWSIKKCGPFLKYVVLVSGLHPQQIGVFHYRACRHQNPKYKNKWKYFVATIGKTLW